MIFPATPSMPTREAQRDVREQLDGVGMATKAMPPAARRIPFRALENVFRADRIASTARRTTAATPRRVAIPFVVQ
jgi:hypothetical protein